MTPSAPQARTGIAPAEGGFAVTLNGRQVLTPGRRPLVVPGEALAREIAGEIGDASECLGGGKGVRAANVPNYRIAATAIDIIDGDPEARQCLVADLAAYGETDLVCFWAEWPESLLRRQEETWKPLLDWFAGRFGVPLAVTTGVRAPGQDPAAQAAITAEVEAADSFRLAALSLAARAAGSVVVALALAEGAIGAETAFDASVVEETAQAERWGEDGEATAARAARARDLADAARFLELLTGSRGAP